MDLLRYKDFCLSLELRSSRTSTRLSGLVLELLDLVNLSESCLRFQPQPVLLRGVHPLLIPSRRLGVPRKEGTSPYEP